MSTLRTGFPACALGLSVGLDDLLRGISEGPAVQSISSWMDQR